MLKNRKKKGFTLIELVIVIAIIGILLAIAVPRFMSATENARNRQIQANARTLASAVSTHFASVGTWPDATKKTALIQESGLTGQGYTIENTTTAKIEIKYDWTGGKPAYTDTTIGNIAGTTVTFDF